MRAAWNQFSGIGPGKRSGRGFYRRAVYCSFSPNDFINGANNFFSSCTRVA